MPAGEFILSFRALFSPMIFQHYPDPGCGCDQSYQESIIRSHKANLAGSLVYDCLLYYRKAMTGNKHTAPVDSTRGQKSTVKDRYKLPVDL